MNSWRDQILKEFTPKVARLTLVADPDGLLLEEGILEGIRERGFELLPFEDHIAFRYAYESKFRSRWDRGEQTDLVVVLRSQASDFNCLPYDLLQAGRRLSFNLGDLFPHLSYPIVAALDRSDFDTLYEAQKKHVPEPLGDNATKEFILRHVFEVDPELIKQPSDLLRALLRRHYRGQRVPGVIDERFIQLLRQNNIFNEWPLEILIPDREVFFSFLQERWPVFLDHIAIEEELGIREYEKSYGLEIDGPVDLPFDHHDIRVYIDTLFLEGLLQSVPHQHAGILSKTWVNIGIRTDQNQDRFRRLIKLIENIQSSIPVEDARYVEWLHFARVWAEMNLLAYELENAIPEKVIQSIISLRDRVDTTFANWLVQRFAGLINLPPNPPVILHHLPRFLSRQIRNDRNSRVVLLLVDGLSLDQWMVVREMLASQLPNFLFREKTVFAWIPTITSFSRQAVFASKPPLFFPDSVQTTEKEPVLWTQFWVDQGFSANEVIYTKNLGDGSLNPIEEILSYPRVRVAGLVIDTVDKIMHGMELGSAGMYNQLRQWAQQPYMSALLNLLLDRGFRVFLTSDHGNIEATGCGRPAEGAVADRRGERVRLYSDELLRDQVKEHFPTALEWSPIGLPDTCLPLLAPNRQAFIQEGERTVCHGGISLEELIVPLIEIERKNQ